MSGRVRLSLELSPAFAVALEHIALASGTTKSDVLRRAIALMQVAVEAKNTGQTLALVDADGRVVTRVVGLW